MTRVLLDTAVFVYARGREHPYRGPCREIIGALEQGVIAGEASVEVVQEFAHLLRRRGMDGATVRNESRAVGAMCVLHDFSGPVLRLALDLVATNQQLGIRDAVHAATALHRGLSAIISPDRAFESVTGLERIDPADALTALGSAG